MDFTLIPNRSLGFLSVVRQREILMTDLGLSNGVPIETLSKLMGHTSIRSTQIYAKITAEKVSNDIENMSKQIELMESFICQAI